MKTWSSALRVPAFRRALLAALAVGLPVVYALPRFFSWIEAKPGSTLDDPLLRALGPVDLTAATFIVLYGIILLVIAGTVMDPLRLVRGLQAYVLLLLLRMISMACITLEPPPGIIPLVDSFTQHFYPGSEPFLKDLFFSGHMATLVLMALIATRRGMKVLAWSAALVVGCFVLAQHVHYTIDVLAAPPLAVLAWRGSAVTMRLCGLRDRDAAGG